jgi:hypothetical protein
LLACNKGDLEVEEKLCVDKFRRGLFIHVDEIDGCVESVSDGDDVEGDSMIVVIINVVVLIEFIVSDCLTLNRLCLFGVISVLCRAKHHNTAV